MKPPNTPRAFVFNAHAFAISGMIRYPFHQPIPTQAMVTLPTIGGHAESLVEDFSFHNMVSFKRAYTQVVGRSNDVGDICYTTTSVTIEGLNILDMFTADVITTRIACTYNLHDMEDPTDDTAEILLLGSNFDGVRIGGAKATIRLDHKLFSDYPDYQKFKKDYDSDGKFRDRIKSQFNWIAPSALPPDIPESVKKRYKWAKRFDKALPDNGPVLCTLVKEIKGDSVDGHIFGNVIDVPNFGTIYLADVYMGKFARRLEMLRIDLAQPLSGTICDGGEGGGSGYPPSGK
jgi:hypothetical protein